METEIHRHAPTSVLVSTALSDGTLNNGEAQAEHGQNDLSDIFGSPPGTPPPANSDHRSLEPSDIPRMRSIHVTNGYREGLSASKDLHIQAGFNEGFSLGAELGSRIGWCLGILVALEEAASTDGRVSGMTETEEGTLQDVISKAEEELELASVFGKEYFAEDGIWLFEVPAETFDHAGDTVTFRDVANAHPLVKQWVATTRGLAEKLGMEIRGP